MAEDHIWYRGAAVKRGALKIHDHFAVAGTVREMGAALARASKRVRERHRSKREIREVAQGTSRKSGMNEWIIDWNVKSISTCILFITCERVLLFKLT